MIKLTDLDPQSVADEVAGWVRAHIYRLAFPMTAPIQLDLLDLRHAVAELTAYAQHGPPHCEDAGGPAEYVQTVVEALYSAAHPDVYGYVETVWQRAGDDGEQHAIDVVLLAATGRERIERGLEAVSLPELAALAGVSVKTLRNLGSRGELAITGGERGVRGSSGVQPDEARRWLSGRGVEVGRRGLTG